MCDGDPVATLVRIGGGARKDAALAALRATLRRLEGPGRAAAGVVPTGLDAIDRALPEGGLARGALHEILAEGADQAAASGFLVRLLVGLAATGPVLWCLADPDLYGPGLERLGLAPDRLILARTRRDADLLWAMEEGLKTPGLAAVLGEPHRLDLTASRRLQLAAESTGGLGLILRRAETGQAGATVAVTRWRVGSVPSLVQGAGLAVPRDFGLMRGRWRISLERCRGGSPAEEGGYGQWLMEEGDDAASVVAVAAQLGDRPGAPTPAARPAGLVEPIRRDDPVRPARPVRRAG
jgi:protein ImuA